MGGGDVENGHQPLGPNHSSSVSLVHEKLGGKATFLRTAELFHETGTFQS